jgi:hypothetical protein
MASIFERLSLYPKIKKQEVFSYGKYKKRCNYPNSLMALSCFAPLMHQSCNIFKID